eukprot:g9075.t1
MATSRRRERDGKAGPGALAVILKGYDLLSFKIEAFRAWCFNPLIRVIRKVVSLGRSIIYPTSPVEDKFNKDDSNKVEAVSHCLTNSSISFYDPFDVGDGVLSFTLDRKRASASIRAVDSSSKGMTSDPSQGTSSSSAQQRSPVQETSLGDDDACITACAFTEDGKRFVTCYTSGQFIVWDANHGGIICENSEYTDSHILAVTFLETSKTNVHMVARDGTYLKWDVEQNIITDKGTILEDWTGTKHPDEHIKLHTVDFYSNGRSVVCTSIIDSDTSCQMEVFIAKVTVFPCFQDVVNLSVAIKPGSIVSGVEMSPDGKGIIVGTSDNNMQTGSCFLWPSFVEKNEHCRILYPGTLGSWSANNKLAVTWTVPDGPKSEANNGSSAFLWNVHKLRENIKLTDDCFKAETLQNPFGEKVLWCRLVSEPEGNDRLIMAIIGTTTTRFLFWDVESGNHTHTIDTGISTRHMTLASTQSWIDSRVKKMNIKGLKPMDVTTDRTKFGAVLGSPCQVLMYDALLGVQLLRLDTQNSEATYLGDEVDIMFSSKNGKIAAIGAHSVMLFAPPTSTRISQNKQRSTETSMIELDNSSQQSVPENAHYKIAFSGNGSALGVLKIGSHEMKVHQLSNDMTSTMKTAQSSGDGFTDFCLTMDGQFAVTNSKSQSMFVWRCFDETGVHVGIVKTNLDTIALGISPNTKELVVCSNEGTLIWLESSEIKPTPNIKDSISAPVSKRKNLFSAMVIGPRNPLIDDQRESLLTRSRTVGSSRETFQERFNNSYSPYDQQFGLDVISCRISADCATAVRLLQAGKIEVWNLKEKSRKELVSCHIPHSLDREFKDLLPLSGHSPSLETNGSRSKKTRLFSVDQGTTILPERDGFLVTDHVDPSLWPLLSNAKPDWFNAQKTESEDIDSIYIVNTNSPKHSRRLKGKNLIPQKGLAISADGRHIACLSDKYASKIVVWNVYSSQHLLPDYHSLSLLYEIKNKAVVRNDIQKQLTSFGPNFFNFKHPNGLTVLMDAILGLNKPLLEIILAYADNNKIKVSFLMPKEGEEEEDSHAVERNAVEACLHQRSPEIVNVIMRYLLKQITHEAEFDSILTRSLTDVQRTYGPIFDSVIHNTALFKTVCKIEAPANMFLHHEFLTAISPSLILTENQIKEFWSEIFKKSSKRESVALTATAITLQFKDACQIGEEGLIRDLLLNEANYSTFGSFAARAIVDFKWRTYAGTFVLQELFNHFLIVVVFTVYCFLLRQETTYQLAQDCDPSATSLRLDCESFPKTKDFQSNCTVFYKDNTISLDCNEATSDEHISLYCEQENVCPGADNQDADEEISVPVIITLGICWFLSVPCLLRELSQCIVYITHHKLSGFVHWLKSGWNWMEVLSYFNIVLVIPLAHFVFANDGDATIKLSAVVAVESLVLWSRMLFYARPFNPTGPFVIVIASLASKIIPLMFLGLCVLFGFGVAFHVLYRHVRDVDHLGEDNDYVPMQKAFCTIGSTMYTLFGYLFGQYEADVVHHGPDEFTAMTLFVLYMIAMSVILMNMVIAVLGEWYSSIQQSRDSRFNAERANAIDDIDSMLSTKRKNQLRENNKGYLHVLIPAFDRKRIMEGPTIAEIGAIAQSDVDMKVDMKVDRLLTKFSSKFFERQQTLPSQFRGDTSEQLPQNQAIPEFEAGQDEDHLSSSDTSPRQSHTGRGMRRD